MSDTSAFDSLADDLDYPMFVVGASDGDDVDACLVGFTSQCSIDPPRFVVFLSKANRTYELATRSETLVVHRVRAEQHDLAEHFGGKTEHDDPGKLVEWQWRAGPEGAPVIAACDWFAGHIESRFDAGDHVAFVLSPFAGECEGEGQLGFQDARDIEAGNPA